MATTKKSGINWKLYGGIAALGGIAYYMTGGSTPPPTTAPAAKKKAPQVAGVTELLPIDYNSTPNMFQPIGLGIKDTFTPLVYRQERKKDPTVLNQSDLSIPGNFTGGETNWAFDGVTTVDGKRSALVENSTSGQSEYLRPGEKWKSSTVKDITENVLILRDVSGAEKGIRMQADIQADIAKQQADLAELKASATAGRMVNSPNGPLNPGLSGPIGYGMDTTTIQPDATATAAGPVQMMGGNGGRPRGRGGRGGGRGGRGGGGGGYGGDGG